MARAPKASAGRSLWERQRDAIRAEKAARPVFPPAPPRPAPGTFRIDQLLIGQCRFACTPHDARSHRFCGEPTEVSRANRHGAWCAAHLPVVTCAPGRSAGGMSKADLAAEAI